MIRRAALQRFCPQGKQRRTRTPAAPLARRARQRTQGAAASFLHAGCAPCVSEAVDAEPFSARNTRLRQDGARRRENGKPNTFTPGAARTLPRRGKQRRRRGSRRRGNCRRETPTARKPENPGFPRHENPMTCIARPSVDGIYWATNTSVERRVCEVDARRRMSGASKTTGATWNDEESNI